MIVTFIRTSIFLIPILAGAEQADAWLIRVLTPLKIVSILSPSRESRKTMSTKIDTVSKDFITDLNIRDEVQRQNFRKKAEDFLEAVEIPKPKKIVKSEIPDMPEDVSSMTAEDLGKTHGIYEAECAWISFCIAKKEIDLSHAQKLLKFIYEKLLERETAGTITEKKRRVEGAQFFLECQLEVSDVESQIKLLKASLVAYSAYAKALSREITNRNNSPFKGGSG
jgi:hypothetical protein